MAEKRYTKEQRKQALKNRKQRQQQDDARWEHLKESQR